MDPTNTSQVAAPEPVVNTPAPVASTPAPQSAPAQSSSPAIQSSADSAASQRLILERLAARGLDVSKFENDDKFVDEAADFYQSAEQTKRLANFGRQFISQREQFEKWMADQAGQQAKPEQARHAQPQTNDDPWAPLEYDEAWENYAVYDAGKRAYVPRDEWANPAAAEKLNAFQRSQADRLKKLARDPMGALQPKIEAEARRIAAEIFQQQQQQYQAQSAADAFMQQNYKDWVVLDSSGQPRIDPNTGMELMTPKGLRALELAQEAVSLGIQTAQGRQQYVDRFLRYEFAQPQQQAAPPELQQTPAEKQATFLQKIESIHTGQHRPSSSTAVAEAAVMKPVGKPGSSDFMKIARENAARVGVNL
jgi:hypothetical protein